MDWLEAQSTLKIASYRQETLMKFVNGWRYLYKDRNRWNIEFRFGVFTLLRLYYDHSDRAWSVTVCNYTTQGRF